MARHRGLSSERRPTWERLRRFRALPVDDRRRFVLALLTLSAARVALLLVPFRRLTAWADRVAAPRPGALLPPPAEAVRIGWAVGSASRFVPGASCLPQALAADVLLRRAGHDAQVRFGVAEAAPGRIEAHAWVESDGRVILGGEELERYTRLTRGA